jgi:hypothetical protein
MATVDLQKLDDQVSDLMADTGLSLRSPFAERHGSLQTVFCKTEDNGLSRFVTIALTAADGNEGRLLVELYLVAEDDVYTRREMASSFMIDAEDLQNGWKERLRKPLEGALRVAQDFRPAQLRPEQLFEAPPLQAAAYGESF